MIYTVKVTFKNPAWDEKDGFSYEVSAPTKARACERARYRARDDGHTGVMYFKAEPMAQS